MKSIKSRMVLFFTAVILVLMAGLGVILIQVVSQNLLSSTREHLVDMAAKEAEYIAARVHGRFDYVSSLALMSIITDEEVAIEEKIAFFEKEAQRTGYLAFAFADRDGNSTVFNQKRETTNIAARDYFQRALRGETVCSDVIISSATGEIVLIYAAPVYKDGGIVGVFYGRVDGAVLSDIVSEVQYKTTGYAYMVNNQGVTVAHKNVELVKMQDNDIENAKTDPSLAELGALTEQMTTRQQGSGSYTYNGVKKLVSFAPVPDTDWIVAFGIEEREVLAERNVQRNVIIVACAISVLIGALITFFVSSSIAKPIRKITSVAQQIAQGNFDVSLSVNSKDEIGQLSSAFNDTIRQLVNYQEYIDEISSALASVAQGDLTISLQKEYAGQFQKLKDNLQSMLEHLNRTLLQIQQAANQVDSGAGQVANGAQALSQGATEQASAIEELSASITEVTQQIKQNAENAKSAHDKAVFAGKELGTSTDQMHSMIEAMKQITQKSSEISKIVKIIDDIAFQTNILALNAAVEAARAGAAGKGFAVVADEVRNLAGKSAEAAKSTTVLIEETIAAVENGSKIAGQTATSMQETAEATTDAVRLIDNIAQASRQQATSIVQINQGIEQVSAVVQTNAATAEESAAASEELSGQSNLLNDLIEAFRLREAEQSIGYAQPRSTQSAEAAPQQQYSTTGSKY